MTHIRRLDIDQFPLAKIYALDLSSIEQQDIIACERLQLKKKTLLRNQIDVELT